MRKYYINQNYFKEWSANMAYILGFLAADGNLSKSSYCIRISSIDKEHLEKINKELESEHPLKSQSNKLGSWYILTINSMVIYADLLKLGLTPNKSLTLDMRNISIPKEYQKDFFRGYFDGDGCFSYYYRKDGVSPHPNFSITSGSPYMYCYLKRMLFELEDNKSKFSIHKIKNNKFDFKANVKLIDKIFYWMYYDNCLCLDRKYEKYKFYIEERKRIKEERIKNHKRIYY